MAKREKQSAFYTKKTIILQVEHSHIYKRFKKKKEKEQLQNTK